MAPDQTPTLHHHAERRSPLMSLQRLLSFTRCHITAGVLVALCAGFSWPSAHAQTTSFNALDALGISGKAAAAPRSDGVVTSPAVSSTQTQAQLLAWAPDGMSTGKTLWLGLRIRHEPHWHTYWKNSGDSGLPTELKWQLPDGWSAGAVSWPTPKKFALGPLANYGFDGTVLLPTAITMGPFDRVNGSATVKLAASWLACKTECIPEDASFELTIPFASDTGGASPLTAHSGLFEDALARVPEALVGLDARAHVSADDASHLRWALTGLPTSWQGKALELYPETTGLIAPGSPWTSAWTDKQTGNWQAATPLNPYRSEAPRAFQVVIAPAGTPDGVQSEKGILATVTFEGDWPPAAKPADISPALAAALAESGAGLGATSNNASNQKGISGWLIALAGAFLGGALLNLMPCVFPVLALKVLAFADGKSADMTKHRQNGLAYTAGVVLSFALLGSALLALREAGDLLGWGFQLQNPWLVGGLATLFTVIALNLFGLFELGNWLPQSVATARSKNATVDAFLSGVLATAVASPCTAPFMGASLGLAIALPTAQGLAIFVAVGLGMASPYLLASWVPAVAQQLPRPGPWMVTFKQLMAFPMMATVVWLLWVFGQQTSINSASALMLWLLSVAWLIWAWAQVATRTTRMVTRGIGVVMFILATWLLSSPMVHSGNATADIASAPSSSASPASWQPWSATAVAAHLAKGQPVFVDFTAAWCVTCQVNKATTLTTQSVLDAFAEKGVLTLQADWTRRNPDITEALNTLGRNGVPTYALYVPGAAPLVLSEIITPNDVRDALAGLPNANRTQTP